MIKVIVLDSKDTFEIDSSKLRVPLSKGSIITYKDTSYTIINHNTVIDAEVDNKYKLVVLVKAE